MDYWSKGTLKALFLEHEGYFGAIGCLIQFNGEISDNETEANEASASAVTDADDGATSSTSNTADSVAQSKSTPPAPEK